MRTVNSLEIRKANIANLIRLHGRRTNSLLQHRLRLIVLILNPSTHLPPDILSIDDRVIAIDALHHTSLTRLEEERHAEATHALSGVSATAIRADAVLSGDELAAADLREQVADVDNDGARDVRGGDPVACGVENLKAARGILVQEGEDARVGVRGAAELSILVRGVACGGWLRWVVEEAEGGEGVGKVVSEVVCWFVERHSKQRQHCGREGLQFVIEGFKALSGGLERCS